MFLTGSNITVERVMFLQNTARFGGGVAVSYGIGSSPKVKNCTFQQVLNHQPAYLSYSHS